MVLATGHLSLLPSVCGLNETALEVQVVKGPGQVNLGLHTVERAGSWAAQVLGGGEHSRR